MYHAKESMTAILPAESYTATSWQDRDVESLLRGTWQWLTSLSQIEHVGSHFAETRLQTPVFVRRTGSGRDDVVAMRNICSHRQCQLIPDGSSRSERIKCAYHGWQYDDQGQTRKIPGAKNFPHFDRQSRGLRLYPTRVVGDLVLAYLGDGQTPTIDTDSPAINLFAERTDPRRWTLAFKETLDYPVDWKVVVEGSLESYHLDEVHAGTFGHDPGEENTTHHLTSGSTIFETDIREDSWLARLEERIVRYIGGSFDPKYQHVHLFPNVMASFTDSLSLVYQIFPLEPADDGTRRSRMTMWGYVRSATSGRIGSEMLRRGLAREARKLAMKVLAEDAAIFPQVQSGLTAASIQGDLPPRILGRCEERIAAFEQFWKGATS